MPRAAAQITQNKSTNSRRGVRHAERTNEDAITRSIRLSIGTTTHEASPMPNKNPKQTKKSCQEGARALRLSALPKSHTDIRKAILLKLKICEQVATIKNFRHLHAVLHLVKIYLPKLGPFCENQKRVCPIFCIERVGCNSDPIGPLLHPGQRFHQWIIRTNAVTFFKHRLNNLDGSGFTHVVSSGLESKPPHRKNVSRRRALEHFPYETSALLAVGIDDGTKQTKIVVMRASNLMQGACVFWKTGATVTKTNLEKLRTDAGIESNSLCDLAHVRPNP